MIILLNIHMGLINFLFLIFIFSVLLGSIAFISGVANLFKIANEIADRQEIIDKLEEEIKRKE